MRPEVTSRPCPHLGQWRLYRSETVVEVQRGVRCLDCGDTLWSTTWPAEQVAERRADKRAKARQERAAQCPNCGGRGKVWATIPAGWVGCAACGGTGRRAGVAP